MTLNKVTMSAEKAKDALNDQGSTSDTWKRLQQYVSQINSRLLTVKDGMSELPKNWEANTKKLFGSRETVPKYYSELKGAFFKAW